MSPAAERRLLQVAVAAACLVPLLAGGLGVLRGPVFAGGQAGTIDLDSHFRYLSGLLIGIGLVFLACIPTIERRTTLFRILAAIVFVGGLSRLLSLAELGLPGGGQRFGLVMELGVVPLLALWQGRLARRFG